MKLEPITATVKPAAWLTLRRYVRFCLVGGSGMLVDMTILALLAGPEMLGWNLALSKVIAAEAAIVNNFLWNDAWTFRGLGAQRKHGRPRLVLLAKFNLICLTGIVFSVSLLNLQVYVLQENVYLANVLSVVAVSFWNFFLNMKFGWSPAEAHART